MNHQLVFCSEPSKQSPQYTLWQSKICTSQPSKERKTKSNGLDGCRTPFIQARALMKPLPAELMNTVSSATYDGLHRTCGCLEVTWRWPIPREGRDRSTPPLYRSQWP